MQLTNLLELEARAREALPRTVFHYYRSGAADEITLRANRDAWDEIPLWPRVLRDVSERDLAVDLFGTRLAMPVVVAPMAMHQLAHPDGEVATARACATAGVPIAVSTFSNKAIEDVAAAGTTWFQLYLYRDRELTASLVRRAAAAGAKALVFTVDAPLIGRREADEVHGFGMPPHLRYGNFEGTDLAAMPSAEGSRLAAYVAQQIDPGISWKDLDWLCQETGLPVLVKGVLRSDDAHRALDHGASGVIVSNHGGRQLDTAPATARALPGVARAVAGRVPVLVDGGLRRGTDVIKALAMGASAVLLGRPARWGLALGGEQGVAAVLDHLRGEIDLTMALCGCRSASEIDASLLAP
jgi:isopentenyl diphosphate isomerase/L-lactate dehydrogenase-like FMN-dependent dehydrogenase